MNLENNTKLHDLSPSGKNDLLNDLENYKIPFRKNLNIPDYITFGCEIECEKANSVLIQNYISSSNGKWEHDVDNTLYKGIEIKSPILKDKEEDWQDLYDVCSFLNRNASIYKGAGGHIHIGTQILENNKNYLTNFLYLWATYENIFYRFLYGEYLTGRKGINKYAEPLGIFMLTDILKNLGINCSLMDMFQILVNSYARNSAINFENAYGFLKYKELINSKAKISSEEIIRILELDSNVERYLNHSMANLTKNVEDILKDTVEFRCPNGTLNPIIWQNNINLITKALLACKSINFDMQRVMATNIKKRFNQLNYDVSIGLYPCISIDEALEFVDIIFDNNLDKFNFLKQYFKDFNSASKPLVKGPSLTLYKCKGGNSI